MPNSKRAKQIIVRNGHKHGKRREQPDVFSEQDQQDIVDHVSNGGLVIDWCDQHNFAYGSVFKFMECEAGAWLKENYSRARERGTHVIAEQTIRIAKEKAQDPQRQKLIVDTNLRVLGFWNRQVYGTRPGDAVAVGKLTLGELVEAAIAHGKKLEAKEKGERLIDVTPRTPSLTDGR
jgi:hypothetical protein